MINLINKLNSILKEEAVAGLDIGQDYISVACLLIQNDGSIKLENLGWVKNEPNSSINSAASLINTLWRKNRIKTRTVAFSFRSPSLLMRYFQYPNLSKEELSSALQLEAEHIFQKPKEQLSIDWYLYPQAQPAHPDNKDNSKKIKEGILVVLPQQAVEKQLLILEKADLYPIALDVSCMSFSRLFCMLKGFSKDEVICLGNLASRSADFSILDNDSYIYPWSFYSQDGNWEKRLNDLVENIKDILRYYQFKIRRRPVTKLVFTGQLSFQEGFQDVIKKSFELPIEFWNPLKHLTFEKDIGSQEIKTYGPIMATSLGSAMLNKT